MAKKRIVPGNTQTIKITASRPTIFTTFLSRTAVTSTLSECEDAVFLHLAVLLSLMTSMIVQMRTASMQIDDINTLCMMKVTVSITSRSSVWTSMSLLVLEGEWKLHTSLLT